VKPPAPWQPLRLPPGVHLTDDGETAFVGKDASGPRYEPTPALVEEMETWRQPPAAAFPLHPLASHELFHRATALLDAAPLAERTPKGDELLTACVWRASELLFRPGRSIRGRIDEFIAGADYVPPELRGRVPARHRAAKRLALVSAWAVVHAACEWAKEAE